MGYTAAYPGCPVSMGTQGQTFPILCDNEKPNVTRTKVTIWRDTCLSSVWLAHSGLSHLPQKMVSRLTEKRYLSSLGSQPSFFTRL